MGTYIVGAIVIVVIGLAVFGYMKNKKSGGGCASGCSSCPYADGCGHAGEDGDNLIK